MHIEEGLRHLILYENCQLVKGVFRSCIYDLTRNDLYLVPNSLAAVLEISRDKNCDEVLKLVSNKSIFNEYVSFITQNELGFICDQDELICFPKLSLEYESPYKITNALLDVDVETNLLKSIDEIISAKCEHLQIRLYCFAKEPEVPLHIILNMFEGSSIKSIDLYLKNHSEVDNHVYEELLISNPRLNFICCYNAERDISKVIYPFCNKLFHTTQIDLSELHCGQISYELLAINIEAFTEAQKFNSCLNNKVSIDKEGNIKNCPSMTESFGNIRNTSLQEAIEKIGFKKYWGVNKDLIHVCKDCEFRYMCTDCRAYVEDPEDILSKPLKCGYNPYTGEWSEWSTNPLKHKAIKYYGMEELVTERQDRLRSDGNEAASDVEDI
jgi:SPASM domain peptide maturase of grasp-with-spasm system